MKNPGKISTLSSLKEADNKSPMMPRMSEDDWYVVGKECVERREMLTSKVIASELSRKSAKKLSSAQKAFPKSNPLQSSTSLGKEFEEKIDTPSSVTDNDFGGKSFPSSTSSSTSSSSSAQPIASSSLTASSSLPVTEQSQTLNTGSSICSSHEHLTSRPSNAPRRITLKSSSPSTHAIPPIKEILRRAAAVYPMLEPFLLPFRCLGTKNIWIVKPVGKSRGRGIECFNALHTLFSYIRAGEDNFIVQKYIERPLLIHKFKFDIRQWVLVTSLTPLTIWRFTKPYFRLSSLPFTLSSLDKIVHLTNNSIQAVSEQFDTIGGEWGATGNMWHLKQFEDYLKKIEDGQLPLEMASSQPEVLLEEFEKQKCVEHHEHECGKKECSGGSDENKEISNQSSLESKAPENYPCYTLWKNSTLPKIESIIVASIKCGREAMKDRKNSFEIFGFDFMIDEKMNPWLIEINAAPCFEHTTAVVGELVGECVESTMKVVLDHELMRKFTNPSMSFSSKSECDCSKSERRLCWMSLSPEFVKQQKLLEQRSQIDSTKTDNESGSDEKLVSRNESVASLTDCSKMNETKSTSELEGVEGEEHKKGEVIFVEGDVSRKISKRKQISASEDEIKDIKEEKTNDRLKENSAKESSASSNTSSSSKQTSQVSRSSSEFYNPEYILKETEGLDTGSWKLIYRERKEQVEFYRQSGQLSIRGMAAPLNSNPTSS
ncbi:putative Tubulin-tyrosine ligase family protein [Monocercomonoides exilis]|uniref:putative Tubulin-tyrosine ligase family protein n=1 Tax=Monocercomonoides exilis TaxID=2049356 RepID=UPI0035598F0E|nr:putative Tubulin-tyrosine ligase family protein [Monocercomonoides exilis]|eukprot:MONOS_5689.1-p1 / transcript=MONOS_5689.1 / gene=MONOS_5689 / organism=Monocercomonoides_exilis_PA203 / gene_product=Tubulin-tyrosine ligase family protein / transcript_product=Tubulin-tyrosine ligase family protein / location=Mono_scaffold00168:100990-103262(-) / protein_length=715 / sequence_SO=supercontig / SO=protein_coding / is_pseudo=false